MFSDFSGAPGPLDSNTFDLDRVDLPLNLSKDFDSRWKMWVRLQPGWYSDFGTVNSDDFILTSLALLSYQWTETTRPVSFRKIPTILLTSPAG